MHASTCNPTRADGSFWYMAGVYSLKFVLMLLVPCLLLSKVAKHVGTILHLVPSVDCTLLQPKQQRWLQAVQCQMNLCQCHPSPPLHWLQVQLHEFWSSTVSSGLEKWEMWFWKDSQRTAQTEVSIWKAFSETGCSFQDVKSCIWQGLQGLLMPLFILVMDIQNCDTTAQTELNSDIYQTCRQALICSQAFWVQSHFLLCLCINTGWLMKWLVLRQMIVVWRVIAQVMTSQTGSGSLKCRPETNDPTVIQSMHSEFCHNWFSLLHVPFIAKTKSIVEVFKGDLKIISQRFQRSLRFPKDLQEIL